MKALSCFLLVGFVVFQTCAQTNTPPKHHKKKDTNAPPADVSAPPPPVDPSVEQERQLEAFQKAFVPTDPWRILNEKTNYAKGGDWVQFEGTVTGVSTAGVVLRGWFDEPLAYLKPKHTLSVTSFMLSGYPRALSAGQVLSRNEKLVAMKNGTKDDLPNLDYGTVWAPELTEEQKAQAAQSKTKAQSKVLAWHQELADKGDAYGQFKMGMRYLTGDGVDKDIAKAKDLLGKSAAQGNQDATAELAKIPGTN